MVCSQNMCDQVTDGLETGGVDGWEGGLRCDCRQVEGAVPG